MLTRNCPSCECKSFFTPTYDADNEYACTNCRWSYVAKRRPAKVGGAAQQNAEDRVRRILGEGYTIAENTEHSDFWAAKGVKGFTATPTLWCRDSLLIYIGARGGLRVVSCGRKVKEFQGRAAWRWLQVVS